MAEPRNTSAPARPLPPPPPPRPARPSLAEEHRGRAVEIDREGGEDDLGGPTMLVRPWDDPVVDERGHDARSRYVETFWLGVLGPTATWLLRRLVARLEHEPAGYELDLDATAREMGLTFSWGRSSPFNRAIERCVMFGMASPIPRGIAVRRRVPEVAQRQLRRMPEALRVEHERWARTTVRLDELERAHTLALAMRDVGDDVLTIEHQLVALGVRDPVAAEVADNIARLQA